MGGTGRPRTAVVRVKRVVAPSLGVVLFSFAACGSDGTTTRVGAATWAIDCVAVLGSSQPTPLMPLSTVPVSGLPRDKHIAELSDAELGLFCDFLQCQTVNGYREVCYRGGTSVLPILSDAVATCRRMPIPYFGSNGDLESREDCIQFYRAYWSRCSVALMEDCGREVAIGLLGASDDRPSCAERDRECFL
jgi:hypothetical protein